MCFSLGLFSGGGLCPFTFAFSACSFPCSFFHAPLHNQIMNLNLIQKTGTYEMVVRAYGSPLGGIWPLMAPSVDDLARQTQTVTVNFREFKDSSFQVELTPGVHSIGAAFLNDAYNGLEDRNLYVDKIEIRSSLKLDEPVLASEQELALEVSSIFT